MKARILLLLICIGAGTARQSSRERSRDFFLENRGKFVIVVNNEVKYEGFDEGLARGKYFPKAQYESRTQIDFAAQGYGESVTKQKRQAFLMAALTQVNEPEIEEQMQQIGQNLVTAKQQYAGYLDNDMEQVLELAASGRMLGKRDTYHGFKPEHVQQMNGLYKLMALSKDWNTFQQNVCFARENLNIELYINALLLAIKERPDTQDLVVPAINEILPSQFYDEEFLQQLKEIQPNDLVTGGASINPQFEAIVVGGGYGYNPTSQYMYNPNTGRYGERQSGDIQQKPWQQWRQERINKIAALKASKNQEEKLTFSINAASAKAGNELNQRISYFTEDVALKNFWYSFNLDLFSKMNLQNEQFQLNPRQKSYKPSRTGFSIYESNQEQEQYGQGLSFGSSSRQGGTGNSEEDSYERRGPQEYSASSIWRLLNRDSFKHYGQNTGRNYPRNFHSSQESSEEESAGYKAKFLDTEQYAKSFGQAGIGAKNLYQQVRTKSNSPYIQQYSPFSEQQSSEESSEEGGMQGGSRSEGAMYYGKGGQKYFQRPEVLTQQVRVLQGVNQQGPRYRQQGSSERRYAPFQQQAFEESSSEEDNMEKDNRGPWNYYGKGGRGNKYYQAQSQSKEPRGPFHMTWKSSQESSEEYKPYREDVAQKYNRKYRMTRDVSKYYESNADISESRAGEIFLMNIQQILARLQMEQLSHQLEDLLNKRSSSSYNLYKASPFSRQLPQTADFGSTQRLQGTKGEQEQLALLDKGRDIEQSILNEELKLQYTRGQADPQNANIIETVGRILSNKLSNSGLGVLSLWSQLDEQLDMISEQNPSSTPPFSYSEYAKGLQNPVYTYSLEWVLDLANSCRERQSSYTENDLRLNGVELKGVKIDKLQTYFDTTESDLSNALDRESMLQQNVDQSKLQVVPVGRQTRLNHKSFSLQYNIKSAQPERVVIRTFLGPKLDAEGNELSLDENRNNFVLLDAFVADLTTGRNSIKRKSGNFEWTSEDSTPLTQIYQQVMQGIEGSGSGQEWIQQTSANNCHFPQRLLLPRGLPQGLPMQLFTIISSINAQDSYLQQQQQQQEIDKICSMGIAPIVLDTRPLGFPLDRKVENEQKIVDAPNVLMKDVYIYHEGPLHPTQFE